MRRTGLLALAAALALAPALAGCIDEVTPRWELDHDHVVAARATPPRLLPGETATLDALVAHAGGLTTVEIPASAAAPTAPAALQAMVARDGDAWTITAPSALQLASMAPGMGVDTGAPVPVDVVLAFPGADAPRIVKKTVWLGAHADNPAPPAVTAGGVPADAEIVVQRGVDLYVATPAGPGSRVNWLTSCGTLFQDDVATAFLRVGPDAAAAGELAVVVRAPDGGVAWRTISIRVAD